ncbi:RNA-directed DNA polymerase-like protein [Gossypium australe]|uniref:RNA-directed DNA polymerase-like protein n=1 Tax=Gossypium australe TaxID=47621 RepID=A0A5B6W747_9ROSI|nr:RNA-directed DNA polymerase-like protein [Gossypium australe]
MKEVVKKEIIKWLDKFKQSSPERPFSIVIPRSNVGQTCRSGYNQITVAPEDQHKKTLTCSYDTFAFRQMPFGLCNAPATFQCMMAILTDMVDNFLEVFVDDFSVFRDSYDNCLDNLAKVLRRCEEMNIILN